MYVGGEVKLSVCEYRLCSASVKIGGKWVVAKRADIQSVENPTIHKVDIYVDASKGNVSSVAVVIPIVDHGEGRRADSVRLTFYATGTVDVEDGP